MPWGWALGAEEVQRVPVSNGMGGLEGEEKPAKGLGRSAGQRVCPGSQWEGSVPRRRKRSGWHGLRMERSENPAGVGQHGGPGDSSGEARQVWDRARAEVWWGWAIWGDITPGEQSRKRRGGGLGGGRAAQEACRETTSQARWGPRSLSQLLFSLHQSTSLSCPLAGTCMRAVTLYSGLPHLPGMRNRQRSEAAGSHAQRLW